MAGIKKWAALYLSETLFWLCYGAGLLNAPDWFRYRAGVLSISEMATLVFAMIGYGVFGAWVRSLFLDKYCYKRIASAHPTYLPEDIVAILKEKSDSEPRKIMVLATFIAILFAASWCYQVFSD